MKKIGGLASEKTGSKMFCTLIEYDWQCVNRNVASNIELLTYLNDCYSIRIECCTVVGSQ